MHLDIRNFFMTIDKTVLYGMLEKKRLHEAVLWLARTIISHNPVENCIVKGQLELFKHLPPHKSLFHAPVDKGLPVGNHTSQFFANVYLNELDQFVKHTLKCKYYIRYCDDFLILQESAAQLQEAKERIEEFARARLRLSLNDKYRSIAPVTNGIDFLGYVIHPDHALVRRRVVNNLRTKLEEFEKLLASQSSSQPQAHNLSFPQAVSGNPVSVFKYDYLLLGRLRAVLASYWGHLKWADTHNLRNALIKRYSFILEYFKVDDSGFTPRYRYRQDFPKVKFQYLYYAGIFTGAVLFFQVGGFYEFYEEGAFKSLKTVKANSRGVKYGFPLKLEPRYLSQFLERGMTVVIIKETDRYFGRLKERLPVVVLRPAQDDN